MAVLDTHVLAWMINNDANLTLATRAMISQQKTLALSPVTFYEIAQKVRLGKWPLMAPHLENLSRLVATAGLTIVPVDPEIAHLAGTLDWPHRDPFDRMLAATALVNGWVLISADTAFDSLIGLRRVW